MNNDNDWFTSDQSPDNDLYLLTSTALSYNGYLVAWKYKINTMPAKECTPQGSIWRQEKTVYTRVFTTIFSFKSIGIHFHYNSIHPSGFRVKEGDVVGVNAPVSCTTAQIGIAIKYSGPEVRRVSLETDTVNSVSQTADDSIEEMTIGIKPYIAGNI